MTIEGDDDEVVTGSEGEGTEGQNPTGGEPEADLSPEQPDPETDDGEPEEVAAEGAKPSRGQNRFQALANERRAAQERADRLEQELAETRRQQWQRQEQQTEAQQREMLALMTPEERAEWRVKQMEERQARERQQDRMSTAAMMDKIAFDAKAVSNPIYAKYRDVIEEQFQKQLSLGRPVEREILLQNHLGKLALDGALRTGSARKQAKARVESQRVSPSGGKGDTPSNRGKAGDTPESRLKDQYI